METQSIAAIITGAVSITVILLKSWDWMSVRFARNSSRISSLKVRVEQLESRAEADIAAEPSETLRLARIETNINEIKEAIAKIQGRLDSS